MLNTVPWPKLLVAFRAVIHAPFCEQAMVHSHNSMLLARHHVLLALLASSLVALAAAQGLTAGQSLSQVIVLGACSLMHSAFFCRVPPAPMQL